MGGCANVNSAAGQDVVRCHMFTPFRTLGFVWLGAMVGLLYVAVPAWISLTNLIWLNVFAAGCGAILVAVERSSKPDRSMAGILYDTEHPTRGRR